MEIRMRCFAQTSPKNERDGWFRRAVLSRFRSAIPVLAARIFTNDCTNQNASGFNLSKTCECGLLVGLVSSLCLSFPLSRRVQKPTPSSRIPIQPGLAIPTQTTMSLLKKKKTSSSQCGRFKIRGRTSICAILKKNMIKHTCPRPPNRRLVEVMTNTQDLRNAATELSLTRANTMVTMLQNSYDEHQQTILCILNHVCFTHTLSPHLFR